MPCHAIMPMFSKKQTPVTVFNNADIILQEITAQEEIQDSPLSSQHFKDKF